MQTPTLTPPDAPDVSLAALLHVLRRHARMIIGGAAAVAAVVAAAILVRAPRYEASVTLATVSGTRGISLTSGAAAALLGANAGAQGGFQATPALISELMLSRRVLGAIGNERAPGYTRSVASVLAGKRVQPVDAAHAVEKAVNTSTSRETGLVTLRVLSKDSALARFVAERIVDETSQAFVQTARAQATEMRRAQDARVDSASSRLRRAEVALQQFLSENRALPSFSAASLQRQALEREVTVAQTVYQQAVGDRESAIAKELEETPAVVAVDPLPPVLPQEPRYLMVSAAAAFIAGLLALSLLAFLRASASGGVRTTDVPR